ncbi:heme biosynthesis protein HemY [Alteromonas halophila]|uniref:Heme biosynthesis protein HemY n=1 Tax=Alteromonas halophila TaxID=516698 RepID=A0A918JJJ9_9ALTE|nr:heme biosynthesis HemY N-terminal domain-containing protein [Alteromonas halophila]GGW84635.1 heme biosynthesis protein HemY [Alteromonas halophila]
MKWLFYSLGLLALLVAALIVAPMVLGDRGYVLITLGDTAIEMTVVSLVISFVVLALAWWVLKRLFFWIMSLFKGSHRWFGALGERKRQVAFFRGIQCLAEGENHQSLHYLGKTSNGDFDGVNYLAAAQAAHDSGDIAHARRMLELAEDYDNARIAAVLMQSRIDLSEGKTDSALARIDTLDEKQQHHPKVIALKARLMAEKGQWQALEDKLSDWRKHIRKDDYVSWSRRIAKGKFAEIASKQGAHQLKAYWDSLPRKIRHDTAYRAAYTEQLLEQGMHSEAQDLLLKWQKSGPDPVLFPLLKSLNLANATPTIQALEGWIKRDDENVELYSALGHVAHNAGDDELAEKVLMRATKIAPRQEDLLLLAQISERRQDTTQALTFIKQGMHIQ